MCDIINHITNNCIINSLYGFKVHFYIFYEQAQYFHNTSQWNSSLQFQRIVFFHPEPRITISHRLRLKELTLALRANKQWSSLSLIIHYWVFLLLGMSALDDRVNNCWSTNQLYCDGRHVLSEPIISARILH